MCQKSNTYILTKDIHIFNTKLGTMFTKSSANDEKFLHL